MMDNANLSHKTLTLCLASIIFINTYAYTGYEDNNDWIEVIQDTCIYDNNDHAAFTSLEEWGGDLYLAFREASYHRETSTDKGKIRVLKESGHEWALHHTFLMDNKDLRDPYMLKWGERLLLYTYGHYSELTTEGWTKLKPIRYDTSYWLSIWKMRVHANVAYGVGNRMGHWPLLLKSEDGEKWETISEYKLGGDATEADIVFVGDTMLICIRIDTPIGSNSMWGKSVYPYTECQWTMMDISVASPEMILYSENTILLAGREYDYHRKDGKDARYVSLFAIDKNGRVKGRYIVERQGGDQGYASFYKAKDNKYYMSYYAGKNNTAVRLLTFKVNEKKLKHRTNNGKRSN